MNKIKREEIEQKVVKIIVRLGDTKEEAIAEVKQYSDKQLDGIITNLEELIN